MEGSQAEAPHSMLTSDVLLPASLPWALDPHFEDWHCPGRMSRGHLYPDVLKINLSHVPVLRVFSSSTEMLQPEISEL